MSQIIFDNRVSNHLGFGEFSHQFHCLLERFPERLTSFHWVHPERLWAKTFSGTGSTQTERGCCSSCGAHRSLWQLLIAVVSWSESRGLGGARQTHWFYHVFFMLACSHEGYIWALSGPSGKFRQRCCRLVFVQPRLFHCDDSLRLPVPRAGGALFTVADYHRLCGRARNSIWNAWALRLDGMVA